MRRVFAAALSVLLFAVPVRASYVIEGGTTNPGSAATIVYSSYAALSTTLPCGPSLLGTRAVVAINAGWDVFRCATISIYYYWTSEGTWRPDTVAVHNTDFSAGGTVTHVVNASGGSITASLPPCKSVGAWFAFGGIGTGKFNTILTNPPFIDSALANGMAFALVGDSPGGGGVTITTASTYTTYIATAHYEPGVSTVGDVETALGATLFAILVAGTAANVLQVADALPVTFLAHGQTGVARNLILRRSDSEWSKIVIASGAAPAAGLGPSEAVGGSAGGIHLWPGQTVVLACLSSGATGGWAINSWTDPDAFAVGAGVTSIADGQFVLRVTATGAGASPTLPPCATMMLGRTVKVKLLDANTVNITPSGAETIDGAAAAFSWNVQYVYHEFYCAATGVWDVR